MGIVPLAAPGQFLVASHNADETETWLYGIDRTGKLTGLEMRFFDKFVQRLRALPAQGVFVLGTNNDDLSHPLGWILNIDPATGKPAWERTYDPYDGTTLPWYDAAEGKGIVTAIGNAGAIAKPLLATLAGNSAPDAGNVRTVFRPASDDSTIFLNGIANVPGPASTSSICGEFDSAAWHIAIDDAVNILWQKKYNHGRSSASLTPILFPNAGTVVAGGLAIVPGDPLRGLLVQSKAAIGSPASFGCGEETYAVFNPADLSSEQIESPFKDLAMIASDVFVNQVFSMVCRQRKSEGLDLIAFPSRSFRSRGRSWWARAPWGPLTKAGPSPSPATGTPPSSADTPTTTRLGPPGSGRGAQGHGPSRDTSWSARAALFKAIPSLSPPTATRPSSEVLNTARGSGRGSQESGLNRDPG